MNFPEVTEVERKLLLCLLQFYREQGAGAAPAIKGIGDDADLQPWDVDDAVKGLRGKGLIEYWPLQPAIRLSPEGLELAQHLEGGGAA